MSIDSPSMPCLTQAAISVRDNVHAGSDGLRLADVADLSAVPAQFREAAGRIVLPWRTRTRMALRTRDVDAVLHARMPVLRCFKLATVGDTIKVAPAERRSAPPRRHERSVADGDVRPGDRLTLVTSAGPVHVERSMIAVQAARPGQRLFVRDTDGALLSVRNAAVRP